MIKSDRLFKYSSISLLSIWLIIFACIPFVLVIIISFLRPGNNFYALPPTLANFTALFNPIYLTIFARSLTLAIATTCLCLLIGYPFAYFLATLQSRYKPLLLALMIIPFWTSSLIRTYAIITLMKAQGPLNALLIYLGIIHQPLHLLYTQTAVFVGLVYSLLPYMILPLYATIEKLDRRLLEAAYDLGASSLRTLFKITVPITLPGIVSGSMLVFLPAMTLFYIPDILGGARSVLLGNLISDQIMMANNWPLAAAMSVGLAVIMIIMLLLYKLSNQRKQQA
jgi:spermidine/putrescine transport system permease protein